MPQEVMWCLQWKCEDRGMFITTEANSECQLKSPSRVTATSYNQTRAHSRIPKKSAGKRNQLILVWKKFEIHAWFFHETHFPRTSSRCLVCMDFKILCTKINLLFKFYFCTKFLQVLISSTDMFWYQKSYVAKLGKKMCFLGFQCYS